MKALNLKADTSPLAIDGLESSIERARELAHQIDSAKAELDRLKAELQADAIERRVPGESTVTYAGGEKTARVTWANKFKDVPESELASLEAEGIADGFEEVVVLKFKAKSDTTTLASLLLKAGIDPRQFFSVAAVRRFVGDPSDERFADVLAQLQAAPGVYL